MMTWLADSYGNVADIEILWTVLAAVGAGFSIFNVRGAYCDWRAIPDADKNGRRRVATTQIRVEIYRLIIQTIFFAIGVGAFLLPNAEGMNLPLRYEIFGALFRWGLISSSLLVLCQSVENYLVRHHLRPHSQGGEA